jgi:hypothetical protein
LRASVSAAHTPAQIEEVCGRFAALAQDLAAVAASQPQPVPASL